jgi:hypothetical protein
MHRVERKPLGLALRDGRLPGPKLIGTLMMNALVDGLEAV